MNTANGVAAKGKWRHLPSCAIPSADNDISPSAWLQSSIFETNWTIL